MNTTSTPVRSSDLDTRHPDPQRFTFATPADRLAWLVGSSLVRRAETRGLRARDGAARSLALTNERDREARELAALRVWHLGR